MESPFPRGQWNVAHQHERQNSASFALLSGARFLLNVGKTDGEALDVLYQQSAGLDVSKRDAKACVRTTSEGGRTRQEITTWSAMPNEVNRMTDYLLDQDVGVVVMEAPGDNWRQFEDKGLNVQLVHAREARNLPGRKTDVSDAGVAGSARGARPAPRLPRPAWRIFANCAI